MFEIKLVPFKNVFVANTVLIILTIQLHITISDTISRINVITQVFVVIYVTTEF